MQRAVIFSWIDCSQAKQRSLEDPLADPGAGKDLSQALHTLGKNECNPLINRCISIAAKLDLFTAIISLNREAVDFYRSIFIDGYAAAIGCTSNSLFIGDASHDYTPSSLTPLVENAQTALV